MKRIKEFDNEDVNSAVFKKIHKRKLCDETGKCPLCPWHGGENIRRQQRTDKYKNKHRRTIKHEETI